MYEMRVSTLSCILAAKLHLGDHTSNTNEYSVMCSEDMIPLFWKLGYVYL